MRSGVGDLIRAKHEFGTRALQALANESSSFEHLRNRAIRDRIISADVHTKAREIAKRVEASA